MTIYVYVTNACSEEAKTHGLTARVESLRVDIETRQSLSQFDQFPTPYLVKKKFGGMQPRLVAESRRVRDDLFVVFLAVMIRGHDDYEVGFVHDPRGYGERNLAPRVSEEELLAELERRTCTSDLPGKPKPSSNEFALLYTAFSHVPRSSSEPVNDPLNSFVCETAEWVKQAAAEHVKPQLTRLLSPCVNSLSADEGLKYYACSEKAGWGIWAYRKRDYLLFVRIVDGTNTSAAEIASNNIAQEIDSGDLDALLRASNRAYPAYILTDEQLWLKLEQETVANMALSPEEVKVLDSARCSESPFPLFINGRAGSGKSTILQYLFADLLYAYGAQFGTAPQDADPEHDKPGKPLYLTANGELLRRARDFVEKLLLSEARFASPEEDARTLSPQEVHEFLAHTFQEFQPFLLSLVPREQRASFQHSKRIDYPRFRRLWEQRFGKDPRARKVHGPDISWHVIRSYIKGMGSDDYLEPEDYSQLPDNQRTVSQEVFESVHGQVWQGWYAEVPSQGEWDDQDLARYILQHDLAPGSFSAVFCDEAQDFTRLELEVLLRLSLYSNRALTTDQVSRVPFAFAGDEFQTLNPTGFRWDSIKASFVEKFIFELDPTRRHEKADLNYHELRFNYRSTLPIVQFGNVVQALRSATFAIPSILPQRPWSAGDTAAPVLFFNAHDGEFWNTYREQAATWVVIVPCNEGEEAGFVEADPILRQHIKVEEGIPLNVFSASRAKGCEYPSVIVYGFGQSSEDDLLCALGHKVDQKRALTVEYFINRVYVAVSRPKRCLVVVDTTEGVNKLWKAAQSEVVRDQLIKAIPRNAEVWASEIGSMTAGKPADLGRDEVPDRRANALAFELDGRARRDPYVLSQAASAYRDVGDDAKSRECRAWAFDYDDKALDAGNAFVAAGLLAEARRCFWRAQREGRSKLLELATDHPEIRSHIEVQWAETLAQKPDLQKTSDALARLVDRCEQDPEFAITAYGETTWKVAVDQLLDQLISSGLTKVHSSLAKGMLERLKSLAKMKLSPHPRLYAELEFTAENYSEAARVWEELGDKNNRKYLKAKANSLPYPDNLDFWQKLGEWNTIACEFDKQSTRPLSTAQTDWVCQALLRSDRQQDALNLAKSNGAADSALSVAVTAQKASDDRLAQQALCLAIQLFVQHGRWQVIDRWLATGGMGSTETFTRENFKRHQNAVQLAFIRALARSDALPSAPQQASEAIVKFLRGFFLNKDVTWKKDIQYVEAGAALERAGRLTDTLQFYESVLADTSLGGEQRPAIRSRWLVVKTRQLAYEKSKARVDLSRIRDIEHDIAAKAREWRLPAPTDTAGYPQLPVVLEAAAVTSSSEVQPALRPVARALSEISLADGRPAVSVSTLMPTTPGESAPPLVATAPPRAANEMQAEIAGIRVKAMQATNTCFLTKDNESVKLSWGTERTARGTIDAIPNGDSRWDIPAWDVAVELPPTGDTTATITWLSEGLQVRILR